MFRGFFVYRKMERTKKFLLLMFVLFAALACRRDYVVLEVEETNVEEGDADAEVKGFYLLNEGNMGTNSASLDYYDYTTGVYSLNIFPSRNPNVTMELGDVGNDLKIYGSRLYAAINCSNLIEVMTADSAIHIGSVNVPNCRYIAFWDGKAYVTSYAGAVQVGNKQLGYVAEIDTATLQVTRTCTVGYNPEELVILDGSFTSDGIPKMYVANSGGYLAPDYDNTISVIDMESFTEEKQIEIAVNPHRIRADKYGDLYITNRGDYAETSSNLYCFDPRSETIKRTFDVPASNICIVGDSLYLYSWEYNLTTGAEEVGFCLINVSTEEVISNSFITDGTETGITVPYGLAVNPVTREIILTDASDYVSPGTLYYYNADGTLKWKQTTGDIPSAIAFYY